MNDNWTKTDQYIEQQLIGDDPILTEVLSKNHAAGLPPHDVAANQGKFLQIIAMMVGAKRILEIGTLGGYSTIWLARALPSDGKVISLEYDPAHAAIAQENIQSAGFSRQVDIRCGAAKDILPELTEEAPFDLIFIDADKPNNPVYLQWAFKLSRCGTVIIGDNVVRDGEVCDPESTDARVQGVRRFFDMMGNDTRLTATALQTVGSKGWDGFSIAIVNETETKS